MIVAVEIYQDAAGGQPYVEWLAGLKDEQAKARMRTRINRLCLGNFGDCRSVGEGVLELRIDYGPGYRVYLSRRGMNLVLLLCGGDKRRQQADIDRAVGYLKDYERRLQHDQKI